MTSDHSIQFFDTQFSKPIAGNSCALNPFETAALPHFHGRVLDFGCGMGNLAAAAAKQGCDVVALDGSRSAIDHLQQRAAAEHLAIDARIEDLRDCPVTLADLPGYCAPTFTLMPVGSTSSRSVQVSGFDDICHLTPRCRLIRFLFVRPALCLRLPSDSQSPATPLPFGYHFPLPGVERTFTSK